MIACDSNSCQSDHEGEGGSRLPKTLEDLMVPPTRRAIKAIIKRGETIKTVPFDLNKIAEAVKKASEASGFYYEPNFTMEFAQMVQERLERQVGPFKISRRDTPHVEDVQEAVQETFDDYNAMKAARIMAGTFGKTVEECMPFALDIVKKMDPTGDLYERYRMGREQVREKLVNLPFDIKLDTTDRQLLIQVAEKGKAHPFNADALMTLILERTGADFSSAGYAVKRTQEILAQRRAETPIGRDELIAIIDTGLMERGYGGEDLLGGSRTQLTIEDVSQMISSKSNENSNIRTNNPEAVNLGIAETILKEYALREVFDRDVAKAHMDGRVHLHDLGYPTRVYCSAHSIEYVKEYGLDVVVANLDAKSAPARKPMVLNNHIHTLLAAIQAFYAGALGFPMVNTLYAPALTSAQEVVEGYEIIEQDGAIVKKKMRIAKQDLEKLVAGGNVGKFEVEKEYKILQPSSESERKQVAQNLIFGASQSAFSRGGQTLFIDFNIDSVTPSHMVNVPAKFLGGEYMRAKKNDGGEWEVIETTTKEPERYSGLTVDNGHGPEPDKRNGDVIQPEDGSVWVTYGHELMRKSASDFAFSLLDVFEKGDKNGNMFNFPKADLHVSKETFSDELGTAILKRACQVVQTNDSIYFMYDRGDGMNVAQCCRLRERITDPEILKHPEKMRFCGFQNVSINLPQIGYRVSAKATAFAGNISFEEKVNLAFKELEDVMDIALKAHANKRRYIQNLLDTDGAPMRSMGLPSDDGAPYIDLAKSTYIYGLVGLNELVQHLTGKELHESPEAFKLGLRFLSHAHEIKGKYAKRYGMKSVIEETPGESANRRLAAVDLKDFPEETKKVVKGDIPSGRYYYTNSAHLRSDAPVSGLDRAVMQAKTNPLIEAGAITHFFTGEHKNGKDAVYDAVKTVFENTQSSQITFSGEHTICLKCKTHVRGLHDKCESCGNDNPQMISQKTRVVGYFSDPRKGWNKSKLGELKDRQSSQDYYAGNRDSFQDLEAELVKSIIEPGKIRMGIVGSPTCPKCKQLEESVYNYLDSQTRKYEQSGGKKGISPEMRAKIEVVKYNVEDENDRVNAVIYNAPIDTMPSLIVHRGESFVRGTAEYPYNGRARILGAKDVDNMFRAIVPEIAA